MVPEKGLVFEVGQGYLLFFVWVYVCVCYQNDCFVILVALLYVYNVTRGGEMGGSANRLYG